MIQNLKKTYFEKCRAVNRLYLGLEPNEKFGLLGFKAQEKQQHSK